jgi:photosystem II stability/assembly factor-like uncharacterized protein
MKTLNNLLRGKNNIKKAKFIIAVFMIMICTSGIFSQPWVNAPQSVSLIWAVDFHDANTGWYLSGNGMIKKTTDGGANWSDQSVGAPIAMRDISMLNANTGYVCTQSNGRVYKTTNGGTNWVQCYANTGLSLYSVDFSGVNHIIAVGDDRLIVRTTNGGLNWVESSGGGVEDYYTVCMVDTNTSYIGTSTGNILKSTNGGAVYTEVYVASPVTAIGKIQFLGSSLGYASGGNGKVFKTTNGGLNWSVQTTGAGTATQVYFTDALTGYICGGSGYVGVTTNGGAAWYKQQSGVAGNLYFMDFISNTTGWIAGTSNSFIKTTNGGFLSAPSPVSPANNSTGQSLTPVLDWDSTIQANIYHIQVSADSTFNTSVIDTIVNRSQYTVPAGKLSNSTKYFWRMFIETPNVSRWSVMWNFTTGITAIEPVSHEIPSSFKLYNNYPNPFNPVTKIRFDIPAGIDNNANVQISVYNLLGESVGILLNRQMQPGSYEVDFNASGFSSGIYFYRMDAGEFHEVRKMMLVK